MTRERRKKSTLDYINSLLFFKKYMQVSFKTSTFKNRNWGEGNIKIDLKMQGRPGRTPNYQWESWALHFGVEPIPACSLCGPLTDRNGETCFKQEGNYLLNSLCSSLPVNVSRWEQNLLTLILQKRKLPLPWCGLEAYVKRPYYTVRSVLWGRPQCYGIGRGLPSLPPTPC